MNNTTITPMSIIRDIAGNVPVEYDEIVTFKGGGAYDEQRRVIKIVNPTSIDGANLFLCAHEAFHAKRHKEGALMYSMPRSAFRIPFMMKEETIVNNLAEAYIATLPLTDKQVEEAAQLLALSRMSYSTKGISTLLTMQAVGTVVVRVKGWAEKRDGVHWTCWDELNKVKARTEARYNIPGIPVNEDGTLDETPVVALLYVFLLFATNVRLPQMDETFEVGI